MASKDLVSSDDFFTPLGSPTTILKDLAAWNLDSAEDSTSIDTQPSSSNHRALPSGTTNRQATSTNMDISHGKAHINSSTVVRTFRLTTFAEVSLQHSLGQRSQPFTRSIIAYLLSGPLCYHLH